MKDPADSTSEAPAWLICVGSFSVEQHQELSRLPFPTVVLATTSELSAGGEGRLAEPTADLFRRWEVHLSGLHQEVVWYCFNDERQNGYQPLQAMSSYFPNLRLLDQYSVPAQRFDQLMDQWQLQDGSLAASLAAAGGAVWLKMPQPQVVIDGMGDWLDRLNDLYWTPPGSMALAHSRAAEALTMLEQRWFLRFEGGPASVPGTTAAALHWGRDHQRLLAERCRQQAGMIASLNSEIERLREALQNLRAMSDELAAERDRHIGTIDRLQAELLDQKLARDDADKAREVMQSEAEGVIKERDALYEKLASLQRQRLELESAISELLGLAESHQ